MKARCSPCRTSNGARAAAGLEPARRIGDFDKAHFLRTPPRIYAAPVTNRSQYRASAKWRRGLLEPARRCGDDALPQD